MFDRPYMQVKSLWSYNPIPGGCVLYLPLWNPHTNGLAFQSIDPFGHTITRTASGVLHFTGSATSNVNVGTIHDASAKLWVSIWFRLDSSFASGAPADMYIFGKQLDGTNRLRVWLESTDGKIICRLQLGGAVKFTIASGETSWNANQWYHIIFSIGQAMGGGAASNGARLRVDNGTAQTDGNVDAAPNGGDFVIGDYDDPGAGNGFIGEIEEVVCGTDDLSDAEETGLYAGTLPGDETEYWPMDEGSGTGAGAIKDQEGTADADGAIDSACTWENVPQHQRANGHYLDGFDDYIDITPVLTNALATTTAGTIGFWVKVPDATPGGQMAFVAFGDTDGNEYLRLFIEQAGKFQCNAAIAGVASWSLETDNAVFSDNVWAYVELIHDGTNASARINGVAVAQTLTEHDDLTAWFGGLTGLDNGFIGKSSFNNNANLNPLAGTIGEVIIHNRALPTAEGLHNYNRTKFKYQ